MLNRHRQILSQIQFYLYMPCPDRGGDQVHIESKREVNIQIHVKVKGLEVVLTRRRVGGFVGELQFCILYWFLYL